MRISWLLPLVFLTLTGCIDVHEHPAPQPTATVVTPAPAPSTDLCHTATTWHLRADALIG